MMYRVVDDHWQETKRAITRAIERKMGISWQEMQELGCTKPVPVYVNPSTGTRYIRVTPKLLAWIGGDTVIGGERVRLGTRVDDDQLPQWLRTKIAQEAEDE